MIQQFASFDRKRLAKDIMIANSRILMLDYDGTLAPFHFKRDEAVPYEGVREILETIISTKHTRVVIITGRTIADLLQLLRLTETPEVWGSHGWEHLSNNNQYNIASFPEDARINLQKAHAILENIVTPEYIEQKPVSIAVHWRGKSQDEIVTIQDKVLSNWRPLTTDAPLQIHSFDGGLELRTAGRNKGYPVQKILEGEGENYVSAYLGDDLTDEDAYEALGNRGLKVLVREQLRPTKANLWLRPPEELLTFLSDWHVAASAPKSMEGQE